MLKKAKTHSVSLIIRSGFAARYAGKKLMKICCFLNVIAKKLIVVTLSVTAFMDDAYVLILFYEENCTVESEKLQVLTTPSSA